MWFEGIAWAQAAPSGPQNLFDQMLTNPILPIALIFVVMYFLFIRPQTKKASDHQKMLSALKRNDEVVTTGGLIGRIAELTDKLVTLEIAQGVRVRIERTQIAAISTYGKMPKREKGEQS
ncbi:MAG TPA: preprotein translocase subunit YajC [Candidatus Binataceae bacterium]|nr:preprotein translocase subunit YajC [Candidatus Binataceae bacterium]